MVNYQELMYEVLRQQEHQQWRVLLHCLVENHSKKAEQLAMLKNLIKEKKKVIKIFTKILDMAEDKESPCESCKMYLPDLLESTKKAKEVAKYNPYEEDSDFMKQYREFQQEIQQMMSGQMAKRNAEISSANYEFPFRGITLKLDIHDQSAHQVAQPPPPLGPSATITEIGPNENMDTGVPPASATTDNQEGITNNVSV